MNEFLFIALILVGIFGIFWSIQQFRRRNQNQPQNANQGGQPPPAPPDPGQQGPQDSENPAPQTDADVKRNRALRWFVACLCGALTVFGPAIVLMLLVGWTDIGPFGLDVMLHLGIAIGIVLLGEIMPKITVFVPEQQGLVALETISGKLVVYGPGFHPRLFTESIHRQNHVSLETVTVTVPKHTVPSTGAEVIVEFRYRYRPRLWQLATFFTQGETTVSEAFTGFFMGFFSSQIGFLPSEVARQGMVRLSEMAKAAFNISSPARRVPAAVPQQEAFRQIDATLPSPDDLKAGYSPHLRSKEDQFGIELLDVDLTDVDFTEDYQKARNATDQQNQFVKGAMLQAGIDPTKPDAMTNWQALPAAERRVYIRNAQLAARVPGVTEQTVNFEGNVPAHFVMGQIRTQ
jgi:hypothetical protein